MREINKQDIEFLKDLQHEMLTQNNVGQASPRFWVIRELKRSYGIESDYSISGSIILYDGEEIGEDLEDLYELLIDINENEIKDYNISLYKDYILIEGFEPMTTVNQVFDFINYEIDCKNIELVNYLDTYEIVPDTMFLTLRECEEHIKRNHYHYRQPHPYEMTAWRSPQVEKLYDILENVDFDKLNERK